MFKPFDKNRIIENIYFLAKEKGLKMGDIEKNAGVSPGYLSRINKSDSTSIPGIDLMYYIAQQLGVSVDTLLTAHYEQLTKADKYALDFIQKVIDDTREEKLDWEQLSTFQMQTDIELVHMYGVFEHEEYLEYDPASIDMGTICKRPCFVSGFYEEGTTKVVGNGYIADIMNEARIYLMAIEHIESQDTKEQRVQAYELYVEMEDGSVEGICNSNMVNHEISMLMGQLYETLEELYSHVKLSKSVKNLLDMYMQEET